MNTTSRKPIADYLREYSGLLESWWPEAGDTHEALGAREILHARLDELQADELQALQQADALAVGLAGRHSADTGWDARMLRDIARLVETERAAAA